MSDKPLTREERDDLKMWKHLAERHYNSAERAVFERDEALKGKQAAEERAERASMILGAVLHEWSRMPDAGFSADDPRWDWWHETGYVRSQAVKFLAADHPARGDA